MTPTIVLALLTLTGTAQQPDWVASQHELHVGAVNVAYTATEGSVPLTDSGGETQARIFFTAYTSSAKPGETRPLTFVWNGGPGGASILLHMFCMGPRILSEQKGADGKQAFTIVDNPDTLLPTTDLGFVDPVGTGFSAAEKADPKTYWGVEGDLKSMGAFIKKYIDLTGRETSPIFMAGESYGTFRAAGLSSRLQRDDVNLKGIALISSAIHFETFLPGDGNDVGYAVYLPTMTATAAHYGKLKDKWNQHPEQAIAEAEKFASGELWSAYERADALTPKETKHIAEKLSELTSIDQEFFLSHHLRLDPDDFRQLILKKEHKTIDKNLGNMTGNINPAPAAAVDRYTQYLKDELGFTGPRKYAALNMGANFAWAWGKAVTGFPNQSESLSAAMSKNPKLKVFVAGGLYDFTTPFYGSDYSMRHLNLPYELRGNWKLHTYEGGHMMYLNPSAHQLLCKDLSEFIGGK